MRLAALNAVFLRSVSELVTEFGAIDFADAHGIAFTCPGCGGHDIRCIFAERGVSDDYEPLARYHVTGTGIDDLSLMPLVETDTRCKWRGLVRNGSAVTV